MYRKLRTLFAVAGLLAVALTVGRYVSPNLDGAPAYKNSVQITTDDNYRTILSNGIPDHPPGQFPNPHNPNSIRPQNYKFRVPLHPKPANKPTPLAMQDFGVAINGVPFDPFAAEWWRHPEGPLPGRLRTRDYYRVEDAEGRRFWLFRHGLFEESAAPRWYLHGLFA